MPIDEKLPLLHQVRVALGSPTNEQLAKHAGVSRRTVQRWWAANGIVPGYEARRLAQVVHPRDREVAARLAWVAGTTLEALGLEKAAPPAPAAPPPSAVAAPASTKPAEPKRALPEHADSVVYAAADALELAPKAVRPAIVAAFAQAKRLGLTVEALLPVLAAAPARK